METGSDWMVLLLFAFYRVWNSPYTLGLTPFEIMFERPPPILPNIKSEFIAEFTNADMISSLKAVALEHKDIWQCLKAIYELAYPFTLHKFWSGDWIFVEQHHCETLEPRWKGPYVVILTTPTSLKVDGLASFPCLSSQTPS